MEEGQRDILISAILGFLLGAVALFPLYTGLANKGVSDYLASELCKNTKQYFEYREMSIDEWVKVLEIKEDKK